MTCGLVIMDWVAAVFPAVVLYWQRCNGVGYTAGMISGIAAATNDLPDRRWNRLGVLNEELGGYSVIGHWARRR
jgi:Na+/proline symporter